ncbi:effector-associated constant component EACC1 [Lentzea flaviverrucosa]|uniref:Caspase domain-containing protein n=1 Tax=Lentzea flaviverrucosa TaxID=200379 RepID=A0A1H9W4A7_9PSEU|nr:caspase family protein [Lentzea flaviverrucosa]RDI22392.1 caspase domain-containing protein [Lentzea flaviverrucosa]SES28752.1 Caspase domain-containing protein [Lentzea flaviverrucosa]
MTDVTLRVHEDGADDERIEQLTAFLRTELGEVVAVSGVPGEAPEGAKAVDLNELGTLLTTVSQSTVLAALINAVSSWLGQRRERSVTVETGGDTLELTGDPSEAELAQRSAWLGRHLHRYALIIASHEFADPGLSSLRAPAHDAARLGEVLADPRIGAFHVRTMINSSAAEVNEAVEDFFADRDPDDLLVLHFSGHGVKDEAGELHFATSGTKLSRLAGTAVSADFVARRMNRSRSRRIVLLLDCCYSGAFGRGMVARAGGSVGLEEQFGGSGRAVITASSAMEYAFEGAAVADSSEGEPSVFTSALVHGLESGDADRDQDGHVGLDELYEYVYDRVRRVTPHQTPGKWMLDVRGDLRIARRARPVTVPAPLPPELQEAIDHSLPGVRAGAVPELRRLLSVAHEGRVLAARMALRRLTDDDSRMVASAAREALAEKAAPAPASKLPGHDTTGRKLSVPPETMGVGASASPGGGQAGSIPKRPEQPSPSAFDSGAAEPSTPARRQTPAEPGPSAGRGTQTESDPTASHRAQVESAASRQASAEPGTSAVRGTQTDSGPSTSRQTTAESDALTSHASSEPGMSSGRRASAESGPLTSHASSEPGMLSSRHAPAESDPSVSREAPATVATPAAALTPAALTAALPRLAAGLALTLLVLSLMAIPGGILGRLGDSSPHTFVFAAVWPWALVAALFVLTCRDHPWAPGAALGLLAGTTGLVSGYDSTWLPYALAATALAVACTTTPWWLAVAGGALGALGVYVVVYSADDLTSISGDGEDVTVIATAVALTCLAAYRTWRDGRWLSTIAPALLVLDAVVTLTVEAPTYITHASLAGLVVVPLIVVSTSGTARFAAVVAVAAGLLVRANDFVSADEPAFTSVAHVALPLAAAVVAYFSRSR